MSDSDITLQDSIMMDDQELEPALDHILQYYTSAHSKPTPHHLSQIIRCCVCC